MRVLVTGAASGIGRATCLRLARDAKAQGHGARIAAVDLTPSPGLDSPVATWVPDVGPFADTGVPASTAVAAATRASGIKSSRIFIASPP